MKIAAKLVRIALITTLLGASQAVLANLVTNGSFEADPFTANGNYQFGLIGNDVTGWYIPNGDGTYPWGLQNGAYGASTPYGNQWIVLGRWDTGAEYSIQQTITGLISGETYLLSFAIASEQGCCSKIEASFLSGSSTAARLFAATSSGSYWTNWATAHMYFLATSGTVTLQFKNINPTNKGYDVGLDNVVVTGATVPEPATLTLLGAGLVGLGFSRRRKTS